MGNGSTTYSQRHTYPAEQEIRYWMRSPVVTVNLNAPVSEALALMGVEPPQIYGLGVEDVIARATG